jgi:hypothetical protein
MTEVLEGGRGAVEDRRRRWLEQAGDSAADRGWRGPAVRPVVEASAPARKKLQERPCSGGLIYSKEEDDLPRVSAYGPRPIKFTLCGAWSGTTRLEYRSSRRASFAFLELGYFSQLMASKPTSLTLPALGPRDIAVAFSLVCSLPFAAAGCALDRNRRQSTQNPDSSFLRGMHPALSLSLL